MVGAKEVLLMSRTWPRGCSPRSTTLLLAASMGLAVTAERRAKIGVNAKRMLENCIVIVGYCL